MEWSQQRKHKEVKQRIRELEGHPTGQRIQISAAAAAALRGDKYRPEVGHQLVFKGSVASPHSKSNVEIMGDTGCGSIFIDDSHASAHKFELIPLTKPVLVELADGSMVARVTHATNVTVQFDGHTEQLLAYVTKLSGVQMILGTPWFQKHKPQIDWDSMSLIFNSEHCIGHCLTNTNGAPGIAQSSRHQKKQSAHVKETVRTYDGIQVAMVSGKVAYKASCEKDARVAVFTYEDIEALSLTDDELEEEIITKVFGARVLQDDFLRFREKLERPPLTYQEIVDRLPPVLYKLYNTFNPKEADKLPTHREQDHRIDQIPDTKAIAQRLRGMGREEARAVKLYIDDMLAKGQIEKSVSAWSSPLLIVKKPGGGIRICVDYRGLNSVTVKNRNAPPLIKEMLGKLAKARFFSKVDVIAAFNKIRIRDKDKHMSAFVTSYGLFQYTVLPFGMCNAPGTFQSYINEVLREHLDVFCMAYLDDVLVFSETEEEHDRHLYQVVKKLGNAGLFLDIEKCEFKTQRVKFLGLIITSDGIEMDLDKVRAIQEWKAPQNVKDVQSFLGFANFYRRFILGFSDIAKSLTALTRKELGKHKFPLEPDGPEMAAFERLKEAFTKGPVLAHFDPDLECIIESDASNWVYAAILSQVQRDGTLRPVAFMSKKMTPAECNYEIYDKELLAIVRAFEEWRPELAGAPSSIEVLTDHQGLQWFATKRDLNQRQIRWAEFLSEFNFHIKYRPGKQGEKPDSLTRRPGDLPVNAHDDRIANRRRALLSPQQLISEKYQRSSTDGGSHEAVRLASICLEEDGYTVNDLARMLYSMAEGTTSPIPMAAGRIVTEEADPYDGLHEADGMPLDDVISSLYATDLRLQELMKAKTNDDRRIPWQLIQDGLRIDMGDLKVKDKRLYVQERLYVPFSAKLRTRIVKLIHDDKTGGHGGRSATYQRVAQWYYWQGLTNTVSKLVNNCLVCRRTKSSHAAKQGLLHPLPIPERYWEDISVDFITPLPRSTWCGRTYRHIMVVVDRLSKKRKFIPMENMEIASVVDAFIEYIWREEGYPRTIVSDRGRQFTSYFWKRLCQRMGTKLKLSTSHHPESDGQTEIANAGLKAYLRAYVNYLQDDWAQLLPLAEFEANSEISSATGVSPFQATKGYHPRTGLEPPHAVNQPNTTTTGKDQTRRADAFAVRMHKLRQQLRDELVWTREKMREFANVNRSPAPQFRKDDWVMLDARNVRTERPVKSLDYKNLGPYQISRVVDGDMAYELDLPAPLKEIFPAFHPWLLHAYENDPLPGQRRDNEPAQIIQLDEDGAEHYEIVQILDSRIRPGTIDPHTGKKGLLVYKVEWKGSDQSQAWQSYANLRGSKDTVRDFHTRHPGQPGPHTTFDNYDDDGQLLPLHALGLISG